MSIYAYIYLGLTLLGLGIALEQNGKPKTGNHNAWNSIIGTVLTCYLLYKGGFFNGI